jgi:hypothetical protein
MVIGLTTAGGGQGTPARTQTGLKILVLEGEGAVNIIQQKTAVAPVVEVRDRNDQPIAGATVRFAIRAGRATFGGPRTLTVTTNSLGRAAVTTLTPSGSGAVQISATATFQGQTAAVTIAQTNVMTASAAGGSAGAAGGAGGAEGGGAAGGGAAGGGGLSTTTLAVVGGAVVGGVVAARELTGGSESYSGSFSGSTSSSFGACAVTVAHAGTVSVAINIGDDGAVTGTGDVNQTRTVTQSTCGGFPVGSSQMDGCCSPAPAVTGTTAGMSFTGSHPGGAGTTWRYDFTGVLSGDAITGTFTLTVADPSNPTITGVFPVTLRKS